MELKGLMVREPMFLLNDKAEKVAEHLHVAEILIHKIMQFSVSIATIREEFSPWRTFSFMVLLESCHWNSVGYLLLTAQEIQGCIHSNLERGWAHWDQRGKVRQIHMAWVSKFASPFTQFPPKTPQLKIGTHKLWFISPEQDQHNEGETNLKE